MSVKNCCICEDEANSSKSISNRKVGTPATLVKDLLSDCFGSQEWFNDWSCLCSFCEFKLLEFYDAKLCMTKIKIELNRRINNPKPLPIEEIIVDESFDDIDVESETNEKVQVKFRQKNSSDSLKRNELKQGKDTTNYELEHGRSRRYCHDCEVECPSEEVLKLHAKTFHPNIKTINFNICCDVSQCTVNFNSEDAYKNHKLEVHQLSTVFQCDICNRSFTTFTQLTAHKATHRPHTCTICGKTLSHQRGLLRHIETHSAESKYQCFECGSKYPTTNSLKKHMLIHSNTRNYKCSACGKRFRSASHLKRHVHNVHTK